MKRVSGLFILLMAFAGSAQAEIYRWTDDQGVVHFTDDYALIPEKDRPRVIIEVDTPDINVMPAVELPGTETAGLEDEEAGEEDWIPPKAVAPEVIWEIRPFFIPVDKRHKRKHKQKQAPVVIPKTPARKSQDRIEEQLREHRRSLDDAQSPARKALEKNEEQIRKMRDGVSGH